jgi:hypothetical protein
LATAELNAWLVGLLISNKRINNTLISLRGILADAFADGAIGRNPMSYSQSLKLSGRARSIHARQDNSESESPARSIPNPSPNNKEPNRLWLAFHFRFALLLHSSAHRFTPTQQFYGNIESTTY